MLSTYPPQLCGLATFAAALEKELQRAGIRVDVVRIDDGLDAAELGRSVVAELVNGVPASVRNAAAALSRCDVAIIQHEYGIYGGVDGDEILDLLEALDVPTIVILHTVPLQPTPHQRSVLLDVCDIADRVVVMTETAMDRLTRQLPGRSDEDRHDPPRCVGPDARRDRLRLVRRGRPQLLTWGLLGPRQGHRARHRRVGTAG